MCFVPRVHCIVLPRGPACCTPLQAVSPRPRHWPRRRRRLSRPSAQQAQCAFIRQHVPCTYTLNLNNLPATQAANTCPTQPATRHTGRSPHLQSAMHHNRNVQLLQQAVTVLVSQHVIRKSRMIHCTEFYQPLGFNAINAPSSTTVNRDLSSSSSLLTNHVLGCLLMLRWGK